MHRIKYVRSQDFKKTLKKLKFCARQMELCFCMYVSTLSGQKMNSAPATDIAMNINTVSDSSSEVIGVAPLALGICYCAAGEAAEFERPWLF